MSLCEKYGIPKATWIAMYRDGALTSKASNGDPIIDCYKKKRSSGIGHTEAVKDTAHEMNCSPTWVYELLRDFNISTL